MESYVDSYWNDQIPLFKNWKVLDENSVEYYHYIWLEDKIDHPGHEFSLLNFISMVSVMRVMSRKALIVFYTNCEPDNRLFLKLKILAGDKLVVQNMAEAEVKSDTKSSTKYINWLETIHIPTNKTAGNPIWKIEHKSDVLRLLILAKFGGIYLDNDMIMLKSHEPHFKTITDQPTKLIIAHQTTYSLANGFMIANKKNKIVLRWLYEFSGYSYTKWVGSRNRFSVFLVYYLSTLYPDEVDVVETGMVRPAGSEHKLMGEGYFNVEDSFNVHIYKSKYLDRLLRAQTGRLRLEDIRQIDCLEMSYGEVLRMGAYGKKEVC